MPTNFIFLNSFSKETFVTIPLHKVSRLNLSSLFPHSINFYWKLNFDFYDCWRVQIRLKYRKVYQRSIRSQDEHFGSPCSPRALRNPNPSRPPPTHRYIFQIFHFLCKLDYWLELFIVDDCNCHPNGTETNGCDASGQCHCKCDIQGLKCTECTDFHFGFPFCNHTENCK